MEHDDAEPPFLKKLPRRDVHHLNDPTGELYDAFDLGKGSFLQLTGPRVLWRGLKVFLQGTLPGKIGKDIRQMPGSFVLSDGKIRSAHRSKNSGDLPNLDAMAVDYQRNAS